MNTKATLCQETKESKMYRDKPNTLNILNEYLLFMFIAFAPLRRTIEIVNIFADNTVTVTRGTGIHCAHTNRKMSPGKLQNVPKIH